MAGVILNNLQKVYSSGVQALFDFTLNIRDKEFIVLVGPSGCGKSTTLRMIAGLEEISGGELYIDGRLVNEALPKDRDIAMVFQNYALYPHMTVYDNMAFGLKLRKVPKEIIDQKVKAAAQILGISDYLTRKPKALSGGQRQRVALGRTIVREPKVFLLDEPLSNLDTKLRASMRAEITKLHSRLATTFIYVTHDQVEAMTMGTRIVVMKDGFMQQVDTPQNLYDYPINMFVAGFIGTPQMNFIRNATLTSEKGKVMLNFIGGNKLTLPKAFVERIKNINEYLDTGKSVIVGVRPEDIHQDEAFVSKNTGTKFKTRVEVMERLGPETQIYCELDYQNKEVGNIVDDSTQIIGKISNRAVVKQYDIIDIAFDATRINLFDGETEMSILERDEGYEVIEENATGAAYVPPTPQEMRARIEEARVLTKEMKAQKKLEARMAKNEAKREAKLAAMEAKLAEEETAAEEDKEELTKEMKAQKKLEERMAKDEAKREAKMAAMEAKLAEKEKAAEEEKKDEE